MKKTKPYVILSGAVDRRRSRKISFNTMRSFDCAQAYAFASLRMTMGWLVCVLFFVMPVTAYASPPLPQSKAKTLGSIEEKLEKTQQEKKKLEQKIESLESELETTRDKMIRVGQSIQNNEKQLQELEIRIADLQEEEEQLQNSLKQDRSQISNLILALERIRRLPPEALLARPGAPYETAQSAMLMGDIIPTLNRRAEDLKINLERLDKITTELKQDREKSLKASRDLLGEHKKLAGLMSKRERLYEQTQEDFERQQKEVLKISAQANNLKDLVERLEQDRKRNEARKRTHKAVLTMPDIVVPDAGKARLPIAGIIRTNFKETDEFEAASMGLKIEGRPGALVTAPMGGVVRFTGPFKRFGNLIIIEHKNGYHSLIAGMEKIDTVVGRSVNAGEPVGLLQSEGDKSKALLYYELRKNGKPIDPLSKIADLS